MKNCVCQNCGAFYRVPQHRATRLQAAQEAHERACAAVEARRKAKDTRGLHEALERARLALNERMRLENG